MSAFEMWMRNFIEEKDLPEVVYEIRHNGYTHYIENYQIVELIIEDASNEEQAKIKDTLVKLDFQNGNIDHFLKHLAEGHIKSHY